MAQLEMLGVTVRKAITILLIYIILCAGKNFHQSIFPEVLFFGAVELKFVRVLFLLSASL